MKYFAKIRYLGTDFHGFQVQPDKRTVQGELCRALAEATGVPCKVTGCSRTDAGVHANEFSITVEGDFTVPADKLSVAVARFLPNDLSLYHAEVCSEDFHPRYDAVSKEYLYRIMNRAIYDPFEYGRAWFLPRNIDSSGIELMNLAAKNIIGKHDFSAFMSEGADTEDKVRTVYNLRVEKNSDLIEIRISANGFLYNMVRIIVGTLVETAFGKFSPSDVLRIIESCDRKNAGMTAPPEGLYLNSVKY